MKQALLVLPRLESGGAEGVVATTARALLLRKGWKVTIASVAKAKSGGPEVGTSEVISLGGDGRLGSEWRLARFLFGRSFDFVFSSHIRINAALCLLRRLGVLRTKRLVVRESTVVADRYRSARLAAYRLLYRCYGSEDLVVAQTAYMAERLGEILPAPSRSHVRVHPNPIDVDVITRLRKAPLCESIFERLQSRPHIVWCGRLVPIKRPSQAVRTLEALRRVHGINAGLVLVGDGPLADDVRSLVNSLQLQDHVIQTGHLANPYPVLAACRVGLLTSEREGFPNVLLEMLACGVRHIVSTPCAGDLNTLSGVTVTLGEDEALAAAVAKCLSARNAEHECTGVDNGLTSRAPDRFLASVLGAQDSCQ